MQFTSEQILAQKFRHKLLGGYHDVEVDMYLDNLARYIDSLTKEKERLEAELKQAQEKQGQVHQLEDTLRDTLVTAQRTSDEVTGAAQQKAALIIESAQKEADRIVAEARTKAAEIEGHFDVMQQRNREYRNQFLSLVSRQMELFESDTSLADRFGSESEAKP